MKLTGRKLTDDVRDRLKRACEEWGLQVASTKVATMSDKRDSIVAARFPSHENDAATLVWEIDRAHWTGRVSIQCGRPKAGETCRSEVWCPSCGRPWPSGIRSWKPHGVGPKDRFALPTRSGDGDDAGVGSPETYNSEDAPCHTGHSDNSGPT